MPKFSFRASAFFAVAMQKTFNAKTPRRQDATILNILLQFLDVTIWLVQRWEPIHAFSLPALRLCPPVDSLKKDTGEV